MKRAFVFELRKIKSKRNLLILISFICISIALLLSKIIEFKSFKEETENFKKIEQLKIQKYNNYGQYAAYGFRVIIQPSIFEVYSARSQSNKITSNIDTLEVINVNENDRGSHIFKSATNGFYTVYFILGSLIYLLYGLTSFRSKEVYEVLRSENKVIETFFSRGVIVIAITTILDAVILIIPILLRVGITSLEFKAFTHFWLAHLVVSVLFFSLGFIFNQSFRKSYILKCLIIWGCLSFLIPKAIDVYIEKVSNSLDIEIVNLEKIKKIMDFEKKAEAKLLSLNRKNKEEINRVMRELAISFMSNEYMENLEFERKIRMEENRLIETRERIQAFFPTTLLSSISEEISGTGNRGRQKFLDYVFEIRDEFLFFYIKKYYEEDVAEIEPFIKGDENIFKSKPIMINSYHIGMIMNIAVLFALFAVIFFNSRQKQLVVGKIGEIDDKHIPEKKLYFVYCPNNSIEKVLEYLRSNSEVLILNKVTDADFVDSDIKDIWDYACYIYNSEKLRAYENLKILGYENIKNMEMSSENVKRVFLATAFASNRGMIAMNSFLKGESSGFEKSVLEMMEKHSGGKKILYLSPDMFQATSFFEKKAKGIKIFPIGSTDVSFR